MELGGAAKGLESLTFSLRRPNTQAFELLRRLLVGAWPGVKSLPVRGGGTPGVRADRASVADRHLIVSASCRICRSGGESARKRGTALRKRLGG